MTSTATKEPFRRLTPREVNEALSEAYYSFAGGLNALNHPSARNMARAAYWYQKNLPTIGSMFWKLANRKIYKHTWEDLGAMQRFGRLDIETGKSLLS